MYVYNSSKTKVHFNATLMNSLYLWYSCWSVSSSFVPSRLFVQSFLCCLRFATFCRHRIVITCTFIESRACVEACMKVENRCLIRCVPKLEKMSTYVVGRKFVLKELHLSRSILPVSLREKEGEKYFIKRANKKKMYTELTLQRKSLCRARSSFYSFIVFQRARRLRGGKTLDLDTVLSRSHIILSTKNVMIWLQGSSCLNLTLRLSSVCFSLCCFALRVRSCSLDQNKILRRFVK